MSKLEETATSKRRPPRRKSATIRKVAHQLLTREECQVLKEILRAYRETSTIPQLCSSLKKIVNNEDKLKLLVEMEWMLPAEKRQDFVQLCYLYFPGYERISKLAKKRHLANEERQVSTDRSEVRKSADVTFRSKSASVTPVHHAKQAKDMLKSAPQNVSPNLLNVEDEVNSFGNLRPSVSSENLPRLLAATFKERRLSTCGNESDEYEAEKKSEKPNPAPATISAMVHQPSTAVPRQSQPLGALSQRAQPGGSLQKQGNSSTQSDDLISRIQMQATKNRPSLSALSDMGFWQPPTPDDKKKRISVPAIKIRESSPQPGADAKKSKLGSKSKHRNTHESKKEESKIASKVSTRVESPHRHEDHTAKEKRDLEIQNLKGARPVSTGKELLKSEKEREDLQEKFNEFLRERNLELNKIEGSGTVTSERGRIEALEGGGEEMQAHFRDFLRTRRRASKTKGQSRRSASADDILESASQQSKLQSVGDNASKETKSQRPKKKKPKSLDNRVNTPKSLNLEGGLQSKKSDNALSSSKTEPSNNEGQADDIPTKRAQFRELLDSKRKTKAQSEQTQVKKENSHTSEKKPQEEVTKCNFSFDVENTIASGGVNKTEPPVNTLEVSHADDTHPPLSPIPEQREERSPLTASPVPETIRPSHEEKKENQHVVITVQTNNKDHLEQSINANGNPSHCASAKAANIEPPAINFMPATPTMEKVYKMLYTTSESVDNTKTKEEGHSDDSEDYEKEFIRQRCFNCMAQESFKLEIGIQTDQSALWRMDIDRETQTPPRDSLEKCGAKVDKRATRTRSVQTLPNVNTNEVEIKKCVTTQGAQTHSAEIVDTETQTDVEEVASTKHTRDVSTQTALEVDVDAKKPLTCDVGRPEQPRNQETTNENIMTGPFSPPLVFSPSMQPPGFMHPHQFMAQSPVPGFPFGYFVVPTAPGSVSGAASTSIPHMNNLSTWLSSQLLSPRAASSVSGIHSAHGSAEFGGRKPSRIQLQTDAKGSFGFSISNCEDVMTPGVQVATVTVGGPAHKKGLKPSDYIVQVGNMDARGLDSHTVGHMIRQSGSAVQLTVLSSV